jgi:hypothetical protein
LKNFGGVQDSTNVEFMHRMSEMCLAP